MLSAEHLVIPNQLFSHGSPTNQLDLYAQRGPLVSAYRVTSAVKKTFASAACCLYTSPVEVISTFHKRFIPSLSWAGIAPSAKQNLVSQA